ncbi:PssD/Cps14F family polysaccharide biosynthesis glycosyltransferase [Methanobacterium petrolearium]|nr:PssD/Cps14F family polysaccharide biosynthesis glycosyltransferase [Methanobacterium petrolearium]BDZ71679.1 hypothetical protein GCM10025861_21960 [Methanobacterium petrolearium]
MKICLVCSPGGHLIEGLKLISASEVHDDIILITHDEAFTLDIPRIKKIYYVKNFLIKRVDQSKPLKFLFIIYAMIYLSFNEFIILIKERPDLILSTGSEIAIPAFLIAKILRIRTIFVETLTRVTELSGTGKILLHIANLFIVQWEFLAKKYKDAIFKGNILETIEIDENKSKNNFIFVTVGTASFPRLVKIMDDLAKVIPEKVIIQLGRTDYTPKNADYLDFTSDLDEFNMMNQQAKIVVSHAGVGNVINILENNDNLIVFPRLEKYNELIDDHQLEFAKVLNKSSIAHVACSEKDIYNFIINIDKLSQRTTFKDSNQSNFLNYLKEALKSNLQV